MKPPPADSVALVYADAAARRSLSRRYPSLLGRSTAIVVLGDFGDRPHLVAAVQELVSSANAGRRIAVERMIDELMAREKLPGEAAAGAAQRARMRARLVRDFGALTASQVADRAGSSASNRGQLASQWRRNGRIFAVPLEGELRYPGFQFGADGRPQPVIADVLQALVDWPDWDIAEWFVLGNGMLGNQAPVHRLEERPADVAEAARFEAHVRKGRDVISSG